MLLKCYGTRRKQVVQDTPLEDLVAKWGRKFRCRKKLSGSNTWQYTGSILWRLSDCVQVGQSEVLTQTMWSYCSLLAMCYHVPFQDLLFIAPRYTWGRKYGSMYLLLTHWRILFRLYWCDPCAIMWRRHGCFQIYSDTFQPFFLQMMKMHIFNSRLFPDWDQLCTVLTGWKLPLHPSSLPTIKDDTTCKKLRMTPPAKNKAAHIRQKGGLKRGAS